MVDNRKIMVGLGLIISFALLVVSISLYYNYQHDLKQQSRLDPNTLNNMSTEQIINYLETRRTDETQLHSFYLLPLMAFIGLLVGTIVYYLMSDRIVKQDKSLEKNTKIILNFLSSQERKVIETLIENNGKIPQYELSHLPNLNKVKTHRILTNLEQKGIIRKEKLGKINKIILNEELFEVLK